MENIINARALKADFRIKKTFTIFSASFLVSAEEMRFGFVPGLLTFVICLSGIAAAFAAPNGVLNLAIVGLPSALFLTSIIAFAPMRVIFWMSIITTLVDVGVFFIH